MNLKVICYRCGETLDDDIVHNQILRVTPCKKCTVERTAELEEKQKTSPNKQSTQCAHVYVQSGFRSMKCQKCGNVTIP